MHFPTAANNKITTPNMYQPDNALSLTELSNKILSLLQITAGMCHGFVPSGDLYVWIPEVDRLKETMQKNLRKMSVAISDVKLKHYSLTDRTYDALEVVVIGRPNQWIIDFEKDVRNEIRAVTLLLPKPRRFNDGPPREPDREQRRKMTIRYQDLLSELRNIFREFRLGENVRHLAERPGSAGIQCTTPKEPVSPPVAQYEDHMRNSWKERISHNGKSEFENCFDPAIIRSSVPSEASVRYLSTKA